MQKEHSADEQDIASILSIKNKAARTSAAKALWPYVATSVDAVLRGREQVRAIKAKDLVKAYLCINENDAWGLSKKDKRRASKEALMQVWPKKQNKEDALAKNMELFLEEIEENKYWMGDLMLAYGAETVCRALETLEDAEDRQINTARVIQSWLMDAYSGRRLVGELEDDEQYRVLWENFCWDKTLKQQKNVFSPMDAYLSRSHLSPWEKNVRPLNLKTYQLIVNAYGEIKAVYNLACTAGIDEEVAELLKKQLKPQKAATLGQGEFLKTLAIAKATRLEITAKEYEDALQACRKPNSLNDEVVGLCRLLDDTTGQTLKNQIAAGEWGTINDIKIATTLKNQLDEKKWENLLERWALAWWTSQQTEKKLISTLPEMDWEKLPYMVAALDPEKARKLLREAKNVTPGISQAFKENTQTFGTAGNMPTTIRQEVMEMVAEDLGEHLHLWDIFFRHSPTYPGTLQDLLKMTKSCL